MRVKKTLLSSYWSLLHWNGVEEVNYCSSLKGEVVSVSCNFITKTECGHGTALLPYAFGREWLTVFLSQTRCKFATSAMKKRRYVHLAFLISAEKWHLMAQRELKASLKCDSWLQLSSYSNSRTEVNEVDKLTTHHRTYADKSYNEIFSNLNTWEVKSTNPRSLLGLAENKQSLNLRSVP